MDLYDYEDSFARFYADNVVTPFTCHLVRDNALFGRTFFHEHECSALASALCSRAVLLDTLCCVTLRASPLSPLISTLLPCGLPRSWRLWVVLLATQPSVWECAPASNPPKSSIHVVRCPFPASLLAFLALVQTLSELRSKQSRCFVRCE